MFGNNNGGDDEEESSALLKTSQSNQRSHSALSNQINGKVSNAFENLDESESSLNLSANEEEEVDTSVFNRNPSQTVNISSSTKQNNGDITNLNNSTIGGSTTYSEDTHSTSSEDESVVVSFSFRRLTRKKKFILVSVSIANCLSYLCLSLLAPFFPEEALSKNVNDTISGWIFGVFALSQVIMSPIFGKLLPRIGIRFMYLAGLFLAGGCTLLFGFTTYISVTDGPLVFIIFCFVLRVVLSVGCSSINTACFTLVAKEFPDNIATVFGLGEVFVGIGFMSGPAIGGVLYGLGGFLIPFAVIGGLLLLAVPINWFLLPPDEGFEPMGDNDEERTSSLWRLLRSVNSVLTCFAIIIAAMIWSILDPTLEPHLREFGLDSEIVGLLFLLMSAFYAISSPIWGWIADRLPDNRLLLIPGFFISSIGLLILGPSTLLGFPDGYNELWLNIVALIVLGLFASAALIPTFDSFIIIAEKLGFEDDMHTYSMVAGLWGSMYALGDFVGPTVGGFLLDLVGFQWTCTYVAGACAFMVVSLSLNWVIECCLSRRKKSKKEMKENEKTSLCNGTSAVSERTSTERTPLLSDSWNYNTLMAEDSDLMSSYPPQTLTETV